MTKKSIFTLLFLIAGCSFFKTDINKVEFIKAHYWQDFNQDKIEQRITIKSQKESQELIESITGDLEPMIEYLNEDDISEEEIILPDLQKETVEFALKKLPKPLYNFLNKKVKAIVLTRNMRTPLIVYTIEGTDKFLMVIDQNINSFGLNKWYKWRELTAFKNVETTLDFQPLLSHTNHKSDTLQFIFAQAIALIISWDTEVYPKSIVKSDLSKFDFLKQSWINDNGIIRSKDDVILKDIQYLSHFKQSTKDIEPDKAFEIYQQIERTNFTSLYASTGPLKDFVESVAIFIHTRFYRRPFAIDFYEKGVLLDTYTHCMNQARCIHKAQVIEKILRKQLR
jgi:hypothetical protein